MKKEKSLSIRIMPDILKKLHYIAKYEGRSTNGHINYLIRQDIMKHEEKISEIVIDETAKS